ncbi:hypothetical protein NBRC111452_1266 [Companilactobacillus farciminis]|jgi:hypothetical protein|nr:hypothetical protein NBRC111452_1266 [Companilactobacillus farciminis]
MIELLKTEVQIWKTLKASDIVPYIKGGLFTADDYKTITGEDYTEGAA